MYINKKKVIIQKREQCKSEEVFFMVFQQAMASFK